MKIIVAGCGKIGNALIENLIKENHDVVAVDNNQNAIDAIRDVYDAFCLCGNIADYDTLAEAGVSSAEMFVAVTGSDELNMLSCVLARKMGAKHTVARVRNPEYNDKNFEFIKQHIDLSVHINPELLAAQEIFNILKIPAALNIETFSRRNFEMIEFLIREDSSLDGMSLIEMRKKYKAEYLICVVSRGDEVYIPDGNFVLKKGDRIGIAATIPQILKFLKMQGTVQKQAKSVMILGGSRIAYYLAKMLTDSGSSVKIIDNNPSVCEELCEELPGVMVINGDGAEQELLLEEGIASIDAFVTLTGHDETNILISCFANSHNVPKVITKVNRKPMTDLAMKLGIDSIVTPKNTVTGVISGYARALHNSLESNIETLYKLMDGKVEALEFKVKPDFKYIGVPLKEMKIKPNILIAGIISKRKARIPSGSDCFQAGDNVVVISKDRMLDDLSEILR